MGSQLVVALTKEVPGEQDAVIGPGARLEIGNIALGIGRIADNHAFQVGIQTGKSIDQMMGAVLGHQPPHKEHIALRFQIKAGQGFAGGHTLHFGTVGNKGRLAVESVPVVGLDHGRIGDVGIGQFGGQIFGQLQVFFGQRRPLFPLPIQAVHVQQRFGARQARNPGDGAVSCNKVQGHVVPLSQGMQRREERVDDGVQVFVGYGRQLDQAHPFVLIAGIGDVVLAAINGDPMAALDQPLPELFDAGLKTAVAGRDPSSPKKGNVHVGPTFCSPGRARLPGNRQFSPIRHASPTRTKGR